MKKYFKVAMVFVLVMAFVLGMASVAYCTEPTVGEQITETFTTASADMITTIIAIIGAALVIGICILVARRGFGVFKIFTK